jgi:hypothetical protein
MPITRITGPLILVAAQPDHQADWKVVINEETFGAHMARYIKFARKQNKTRQEFYPLAHVERANKADRDYRIFGIFQR